MSIFRGAETPASRQRRLRRRPERRDFAALLTESKVLPPKAFAGSSIKSSVKALRLLSPNGGVRGWVNHRDYTGFIYTDLFKKEGK